MRPEKDLPISEEWSSVSEYVESLLHFSTNNLLFQTLCGGIHILDFFTRDPPLFNTVLPEEWLPFLLEYPIMDLLDLLLRDDLTSEKSLKAPASLRAYIHDIRRHSLNRSYTPRVASPVPLPRHVAVGMVPKKIHEVTAFADYVNHLADNIQLQHGHPITHFVDFGAGQNYLGRALASPPYNRHIVAVESKEVNVVGARGKDVQAGIAEREKVSRNKKLFKKQLDDVKSNGRDGATVGFERSPDKVQRTAEQPSTPVIPLAQDLADLRPNRDLAMTYLQQQGRGSIQYISAILNDGNLSAVISDIPKSNDASRPADPVRTTSSTNPTSSTDLNIMAISIHSCGNLSHFGITSLLLNPAVKSIAIVGCCYNLLTEKLGPPTTKHPSMKLRPQFIPINSNPNADKQFLPREKGCDPHGYPLSNRVTTYPSPIFGPGIRLNITARMMAVQAPQNWTDKESDSFFTRHYYRALLQKIFYDYGVVIKPNFDQADNINAEGTEPIIIGSLRKSCYTSFTAYVRGAIAKILSHPDRATPRMALINSITDEQIQAYEADRAGDSSTGFGLRKKELSIMWSLMAFSAGVVESLIVTDRWLWLKEQGDAVKDAWVETVFDYSLSPRNLVVVGIKK